MKTVYLLAYLGVGAAAFSAHVSRQDAVECPLVSLNATSNVWKSYRLHTNPIYRDQVLAAAEVIKDLTLKKKALKVADVGSFLWLSNTTHLSQVEKAAFGVPCNRIVGLVLHGTKYADCSSRKFNPLDLEAYQKTWVDALATTLESHPRTAFAIIIEPQAVTRLVINADLAACRASAASFRANIAYALKTLSLPNVVLYLDAGHGGSLGWDENNKPAVNEFDAVYKAADQPSQLRGFGVNIGHWNAWDLSPGEFATTREVRNRAQNEQTWVRILGGLLGKAGLPNHAVMDTSRNGVAGLRYEWMGWCNVNGAGFGRLPSAEGTGLDLADAFVWAKGGGVSDGTSDPASPNYDVACGGEDAFKPSPEEGEWNQPYFEVLLREAKPKIKVEG